MSSSGSASAPSAGGSPGAAPRRLRVRGPHGEPPTDQVCCGWGPDGWVSAPPQAATLVLGPPRSGKTLRVLIPNVAAWAGPVLVTSTRRVVLDATRRARRRPGICWVFDPLGVVDPLPPTVHRLVWPPSTAPAAGMSPAGAPPPSPSTPAAASPTPPTGALAPPSSSPSCSTPPPVASATWPPSAPGSTPSAPSPPKALGTAPQAQAVLAGLVRTPDRERGSIWSAAQGILAPFDTAQLCAAADATPVVPFDAGVFLGGAHTAYVVSPSDAPTDGAPLVVGLVEEVREAARARSDA